MVNLFPKLNVSFPLNQDQLPGLRRRLPQPWHSPFTRGGRGLDSVIGGLPRGAAPRHPGAGHGASSAPRRGDSGTGSGHAVLRWDGDTTGGTSCAPKGLGSGGKYGCLFQYSLWGKRIPSHSPGMEERGSPRNVHGSCWGHVP